MLRSFEAPGAEQNTPRNTGRNAVRETFVQKKAPVESCAARVKAIQAPVRARASGIFERAA